MVEILIEVLTGKKVDCHQGFFQFKPHPRQQTVDTFLDKKEWKWLPLKEYNERKKD